MMDYLFISFHNIIIINILKDGSDSLQENGVELVPLRDSGLNSSGGGSVGIGGK
jgi:hypothetical protein